MYIQVNTIQICALFHKYTIQCNKKYIFRRYLQVSIITFWAKLSVKNN